MTDSSENLAVLARCIDSECVEDGCAEQDCCRGEGCTCRAAEACSTTVPDYHDDGTVTRWCLDHECEFLSPR